MSAYMLFENSTFQIRVLARRSVGLPHLSYHKALVDVGGRLKRDEGVDNAVFDRLRNTDDAPRYVTYLMFDSLHLFILNCSLYLGGEKWSEIFLYIPEGSQLAQVFQDLLDSAVAMFKTTKSSPPQSNVVELDEDGVPVN